MELSKLRKEIENIINQSGLPIDAIYFVLKDIMNEVISIYTNEINKNYEQENNSLKEGKNEEI